MAVSSSKVYFYNSDNGDRVYDADSFSDWLSKFFTTGVFQNDLYVQAMTGMNVMVNTGYCNIKGKVRDFDEVQELTVSPAHSQYPRIDAIVVERNDTDRDITVKYVQGQISGATPSAPTMQRDTLVYQICLAQIYVNAGVTSITQANITDTRPDADLCGWVVSTVDEIDITQIMSQNKAQFEEWFEHAKGQLDTDVAGHLQLEIDDINGTLDEMHYVTTFPVAPTDWVNNQYTFHDSHIVAMAYDDVSNITQMVYQEGLAPYIHKQVMGDADITLSNFVDGAFTMTVNGTVPPFTVRFYYEKIIYKEAQ